MAKLIRQPNKSADIAGMDEYAASVKEQQEISKTEFDQKKAKENFKEITDMLHPDVPNVPAVTKKDIEDAVNVDTSPEITDGMTIDNMDKILANLRKMVNMFEGLWRDTEREFKLKDSHMKQLYQWNEQHAQPMPDDLTDEEKERWDHFNGLESITEEEVLKIFGEGHPIIGVDHTQTKDRIHDATEEFFNYLDAMREYNIVHKAYLQAIEMKERENIQYLLKVKDEETDAEKKAQMEEAVNNYYYYKLLGFLGDELTESELNKLVKVYGDGKTLDYWISRTREKLKQAHINQKFILEISQFEIRFLPEKYHCISNALLLRFLQICTFANIGDPKDDDRRKVIMMTMAMDCVIRNIFQEDVKSQVIENIEKYLDQVIEPLKKAYPKEVGGYKEDKPEDEPSTEE